MHTVWIRFHSPIPADPFKIILPLASDIDDLKRCALAEVGKGRKRDKMFVYKDGRKLKAGIKVDENLLKGNGWENPLLIVEGSLGGDLVLVGKEEGCKEEEDVVVVEQKMLGGIPTPNRSLDVFVGKHRSPIERHRPRVSLDTAKTSLPTQASSSSKATPQPTVTSIEPEQHFLFPIRDTTDGATRQRASIGEANNQLPTRARSQSIATPQHVRASTQAEHLPLDPANPTEMASVQNTSVKDIMGVLWDIAESLPVQRDVVGEMVSGHQQGCVVDGNGTEDEVEVVGEVGVQNGESGDDGDGILDEMEVESEQGEDDASEVDNSDAAEHGNDTIARQPYMLRRNPDREAKKRTTYQQEVVTTDSISYPKSTKQMIHNKRHILTKPVISYFEPLCTHYPNCHSTRFRKLTDPSNQKRQNSNCLYRCRLCNSKQTYNQRRLRCRIEPGVCNEVCCIGGLSEYRYVNHARIAHGARK